jgi:isopentenyl-diphosphate delta-isomerase
MDSVILVNDQDVEIGTMEKMLAHQKGLLHRAFSVVLFNSRGEVLLQKRAATKYHSAGLWTNTCCSHPKPGEAIDDTIRKRLDFEMGIEARTTFSYKFIYKTNLEHDLIEFEYDHVYTGIFDGRPQINVHEVEDWKFMGMEDLKHDIARNPGAYTYWFKLIVQHPNLLAA